MVSKELLSGVLGRKVKTVDGISNNALYYSTERNPDETLNLDTLTRLCKEWCFANGYTISTSPDNVDSLDEEVEPSGKILYWSVYVDMNHLTRGSTELKVVAKATEWVASKKELV